MASEENGILSRAWKFIEELDEKVTASTGKPLSAVRSAFFQKEAAALEDKLRKKFDRKTRQALVNKLVDFNARGLAQETVEGLLGIGGINPVEGAKEILEFTKEELGFSSGKSQTVETLQEEQEISKRKRFSEQCFLLDNILSIQKSLRNAEYKNLVLLEGQNPLLAVHKLVSQKGIQELVNLTPAQRAILVPKIRLFKVNYPTKEHKNFASGIEEEFIFSDHTSRQSIDNITKGIQGRGDDIGLKSFDYEFAGVRPSEEGYVKCKFVLLFQSADSLAGSSFINLIIPNSQTLSKEKDQNDELIPEEDVWNPEHFEIKAQVGWAVPPKNDLISPELSEKIRSSSVIIHLILGEHQIDLKDDGSVELTVETQGALEGRLRYTNLLVPSVFQKKGRIEEKRRELRELLEYQRKNPLKVSKKANPVDELLRALPEQARRDFLESNPGPTQANQLIDKSLLVGARIDEENAARNALERAKTIEKQRRYSRLIDKMYREEKIWMIEVDDITIDDLLENEAKVTDKEGEAINRALNARRIVAGIVPKIVDTKTRKKIAPYSTTKILIEETGRSDYFNKTKQLSEKEIENRTKNSLRLNKILVATKAKGKTRIYYTTFGNILQSALSIVGDYDSSLLKDMDIILGPMVFRDPRNKKNIISVNIADIPISLNLFSSWFVDEVVKPQINKYSVNQLIQGLFKKLIFPTLQTECFSNSQIKADLGIHPFSIPSLDGKSPLGDVKVGSRFKIEDIERRTISGNITNRGKHKPIGDLFHYLYIYVTNHPVIGKEFRGNKIDDELRGVYHLKPARDVGLVKRISLRKLDQQGLREHMLTSHKGLEQARSVYNANVGMIGNTLFQIGQYVFLGQQRLGIQREDISRKLGFGGYYSIIGINHHISATEYEVELDCRFVGFDERKNVVNVSPVPFTAGDIMPEARGGLSCIDCKATSNEPKLDQK